MRKLFGSAGARPYRLWEILHIGICLRCALLVYLAWRFKNVTSGTWSLALFFSIFFCSTIQSIMAAVLLFAGSMDREFLRLRGAKVRALASRVRAGKWRAGNDHGGMDRRRAHDFGRADRVPRDCQ